MLLAAQAAVRNPRSKGALWATRTQSWANARNARSAAAAEGARLTIASVMPVSSQMSAGIGPPGRTSEENSPVSTPPLRRTAPISVSAASPGSHPVVSTSTTTRS